MTPAARLARAIRAIAPEARAFDPNRPLPLVVGRERAAECAKHGLPPRLARRWVSTVTYSRACAAEGARQHLFDGTPVGPITPEQAQMAKLKLAAWVPPARRAPTASGGTLAARGDPSAPSAPRRPILTLKKATT